MPLLITGVVSLAAEDEVVLLDPVEDVPDVGDLVGDPEGLLLLLLPLEGLRLMTLDGVLLAFFLSVSYGLKETGRLTWVLATLPTPRPPPGDTALSETINAGLPALLFSLVLVSRLLLLLLPELPELLLLLLPGSAPICEHVWANN